MLFNDLYSNVQRQWKSGENDELILKKALNMYQKENKKAFKSIDFWNLWKDNQKWEKGKTSEKHIDSGSKRLRTFESDYTTFDVRVGIDFNDDEPVQVTPPSRPMEWIKRNAKT